MSIRYLNYTLLLLIVFIMMIFSQIQTILYRHLWNWLLFYNSIYKFEIFFYIHTPLFRSVCVSLAYFFGTIICITKYYTCVCGVTRTPLLLSHYYIPRCYIRTSLVCFSVPEHTIIKSINLYMNDHCTWCMRPWALLTFYLAFKWKH